MRLLSVIALVFFARVLFAQCNPPVTIAPVPSLCNGDLTYQLQATPAGGVWSGFLVSPSGSAYIYNQFGQRSATYMYSDSTCTDTVTVSFQVIAGPGLNAGTDFSIVCGNTARVNGSFIPGPNVTAFWSTSDGHLVGAPTDMNALIDKPGTYVLTAINNTTGCARRDTTVCYPYLPSFPHIEIKDTICQGDTLLGYTKSGNFYDKYDIGAPCDSFRVLRLTVLQPLRDTLTAITCANIPVAGYSAAGMYVDTFAAVTGCDSIRVLNLAVLPLFATVLSATTCDPAQAGVFTAVLAAANGCDSTVTTTVELLPSLTTTLSATTCDPAQAGVFTAVLAAANGCDSTVTTTVELLPNFSTDISSTTCDPAQAGVFTAVYNAANGCDSLVTTTVELLPTSTTNISATTCDPAQAGVFTAVYNAANGCDSVVTTTVELLPGFTTTLSATTCDPAQAGVFTALYNATNGCDSVVTTTVELLPGFTTNLSTTTCDPAQTGVFTFVFTAANGCDSTVIFTVSLLPPPAVTSEIQADHGLGDGSIAVLPVGNNPPYQFAWSTGDSTAMIAGLGTGNYTLTLTDAAGCSAVFSFFVPLSVGISTPEANPVRLTASPNPARAGETVSFHLTTPDAGEYRVSVFDATGRLIRQHEHAHPGNESRFSLTFGQGGIQFVRLTDMRGRNTWARVAVSVRD